MQLWELLSSYFIMCPFSYKQWMMWGWGREGSKDEWFPLDNSCRALWGINVTLDLPHVTDTSEIMLTIHDTPSYSSSERLLGAAALSFFFSLTSSREYTRHRNQIMKMACLQMTEFSFHAQLPRTFALLMKLMKTAIFSHFAMQVD